MIADAEQARSIVEAALIIHDVPPAHARIQADLLIEAEMRGFPSHGLLRLRRIVERIRNGVTDPGAAGKQQWLARGFLDVDGERGLGPVVALNALATIEERAREDGLAIAAIHNSNHIGMLAWYAEQVAARRLIVIGMTTSEALVHPWNGRRKLLGTNPLAIGVPASPAPLVLDMATSLVAMGKIHDYANRGEAIPADWALDADGNPTTDATAAKNGAIAPFGGAKGYALGLALEVLVVSLSGSAIGTDVKGTLDSDFVCNKGDVFIVLAPKHGNAIERLVSAYLDEVRGSAPAEIDIPVTVPGDRARHRRAESLGQGLKIDDHLWRDLLALSSTFSPDRAVST